MSERIAAITPPCALVLLRLLLNNPQKTASFRPNPTTLCNPTDQINSAETSEIRGRKCRRRERSDILQFEKRCEVWQNEIRAGSVLAHVTKRIAAITPPRALVVLRFLLNSTEETDRIWPNPTTPCYLTNYCRSAETGERIGLGGDLDSPQLADLREMLLFNGLDGEPLPSLHDQHLGEIGGGLHLPE